MGQYLGLHDADGNQLIPFTDAGRDADPFWVTDVDLGSLGVREQVDDSTTGDGTDDATANTGAAGISVTVIAKGNADGSVAYWLDLLRGWLLPEHRLYLHVQLAEWDGPRRVQVRGQDMPRTLTARRPELQIQWKAPLGFLEDVDVQQLWLPPQSATMPGLVAPVTAPVFAPPANLTGRPPFVVGGNARTWWEADIYGGCAGGPKLTADGWAVVGKTGLAIPAGHFVRLIPNGPTGPLVLFDGDPDQDLYDQINWSASDVRPLVHGTNNVFLTASAGYSAGFGARLTWRRRWA